MDIENVKKLLKSRTSSQWDDSSIVAKGTIVDNQGDEIAYSVYEGWHLYAASQCDSEWGQDLTSLLQSIDEHGYSDDDLVKVVDSLSIEDRHWNWHQKALFHNLDEYRWFYLYANDKPQGACLIFQPKKSSLSDGNIFYIEFISVAPWNRNNLHRAKVFGGIGTILIKTSLKYATEKLGLQPGFSLHSLSKAEGYYKHLKMQHIEEKDKPRLKHFELPLEFANELLKSS